MQTRRDFLKTSGQAALSVAALGTAASRVFAAGSDTLRVGVIGCGGRGTGAATNCLESSPGIEIVAMADAFTGRMEGAVSEIKKWCTEQKRPVDQCLKVTPERMFAGYDAYRRLLALKDVDVVIMAAPPAFRPVHFEEAIKAGKHVFMEKPVAVDPPGARKVMAGRGGRDPTTLQEGLPGERLRGRSWGHRPDPHRPDLVVWWGLVEASA
jgi:myo-inositol 2-dehydrogenase/D-chiro-inositol 1-dehydrogenase